MNCYIIKNNKYVLSYVVNHVSKPVIKLTKDIDSAFVFSNVELAKFFVRKFNQDLKCKYTYKVVE